MGTKLDLRSEQKEERRRRILEAARGIIADRGYEALTMRDLAAASRVTVPTIYNLVGSKEEVLSSAIADQTEGFIAGISSASRNTPASGILEVVEANCAELLRLPDYYQSLLRLLFSSANARGMREGVTDAVVRTFEQGLEEMRRAGDLEEWAEIPALANRLGSLLRITALDWAGGDSNDEGMRSASLLGASLLILGVARGDSRRELEECARSVQASSTQRPHAAEAKPANS